MNDDFKSEFFADPSVPLPETFDVTQVPDGNDNAPIEGQMGQTRFLVNMTGVLESTGGSTGNITPERGKSQKSRTVTPQLKIYSAIDDPNDTYAEKLHQMTGGKKSAIGRSVASIMRLGGGTASKKETKEQQQDVVDRGQSKAFIADAERVLREHAQVQQDSQGTMRRYQELLDKAKNQPGSQESLSAMRTLVQTLKSMRNERNTSAELSSAATSAIRKAPQQASVEPKQGDEQQRRAA